MVVRPYGCPNLWLSEWLSELKEEVKYYFADFVRKGGGRGNPQIRNFLLAKILSVKGGGGGTPPYGQSPQSSIWPLPLRVVVV